MMRFAYVKKQQIYLTIKDACVSSKQVDDEPIPCWQNVNGSEIAIEIDFGKKYGCGPWDFLRPSSHRHRRSSAASAELVVIDCVHLDIRHCFHVTCWQLETCFVIYFWTCSGICSLIYYGFQIVVRSHFVPVIESVIGNANEILKPNDELNEIVIEILIFHHFWNEIEI